MLNAILIPVGLVCSCIIGYVVGNIIAKQTEEYEKKQKI